MEPDGSSPSPVPILSHLHPVSTPSHFPKFHINIILLSTSVSPQWFFPSCFSTRSLCTPLSSHISATCPALLILLDFTTRRILGGYSVVFIFFFFCFTLFYSVSCHRPLLAGTSPLEPTIFQAL